MSSPVSAAGAASTAGAGAVVPDASIICEPSALPMSPDAPIAPLRPGCAPLSSAAFCLHAAASTNATNNIVLTMTSFIADAGASRLQHVLQKGDFHGDET